MNYYLFLDESGNHGLTEINPNSPVFLLCGVLFQAEDYQNFREQMNLVKMKFWRTKEVIFHSRDIRKCQKEFSILLDLEVKAKFYECLNACITRGNYIIITSAIRKDKYIQRFGKLCNDVYELSLSFIIERSIFYLDDIRTGRKRLHIILEERGKKEDNTLKEHFQRLMARGTGFVSADRLNKYGLTINFRNKKQNVNGLQIADLVAYPSATFVNDRKRANPAFDILKPKFYRKNGKVYGFKIYP